MKPWLFDLVLLITALVGLGAVTCTRGSCS